MCATVDSRVVSLAAPLTSDDVQALYEHLGLVSTDMYAIGISGDQRGALHRATLLAWCLTPHGFPTSPSQRAPRGGKLGTWSTLQR